MEGAKSLSKAATYLPSYQNIETGAIRHLIVQPEQTQQYRGHFTRFSRLLHNPKFAKQIARINVDEAHFIIFQGIIRYKTPAFRPAWGQLAELRTRLRKDLTIQAMSATLPPHIRRTVCEKLGMDLESTSVFETSVNRPNMIYATHPLIKSISNMRNFDFLVPQPFHPPMKSLLKAIIFHDSKEEAVRAATGSRHTWS
jgi:superfamily II DNA helicase RecQ